jgi:hypothetical protein
MGGVSDTGLGIQYRCVQSAECCLHKLDLFRRRQRRHPWSNVRSPFVENDLAKSDDAVAEAVGRMEHPARALKDAIAIGVGFNLLHLADCPALLGIQFGLQHVEKSSIDEFGIAPFPAGSSGLV